MHRAGFTLSGDAAASDIKDVCTRAPPRKNLSRRNKKEKEIFERLRRALLHFNIDANSGCVETKNGGLGGIAAGGRSSSKGLAGGELRIVVLDAATLLAIVYAVTGVQLPAFRLKELSSLLLKQCAKAKPANRSEGTLLHCLFEYILPLALRRSHKSEAMEAFQKVFGRRAQGAISEQGIRRAIKALGLSLHPATAREMLSAADYDANGKISFHEFQAITRAPPP
mmetsp:Transcript_11096/g.15399  ORF Transcript_11096/g.15399 Transcript_11096/m.15399 type:complete len:225 (-) Transcript_11096:203-877(-)|eukprot:CAMPEP_0185268736 /NCGR_PEP_ID=MMETSP1359-20130426/37856_1 /TAXON_ID=552665 /ORGANISM="Bigelowiella longifila, Strain CCMP242" /LENGTH=224 /DNA_ID=CAMNT_0027859607 /DNA_START=44 /DNA_END=718 /DNA_ORIENTATION=+